MNEKINALRYDSVSARNYFLKHLAYTLGPVELKNFIQKGGVKIVDVREEADYQAGHIPGAISIPKAELANNIEKLSKEEITVIYCYNQQCHLGESACLVLTDYDYPVMLMEGGFDTWVNSFKFEVEQ